MECRILAITLLMSITSAETNETGNNDGYDNSLQECYNTVMQTRGQQGIISTTEGLIYSSLYILIGFTCIVLNSLLILRAKAERPIEVVEDPGGELWKLRLRFIWLRCSLAAANMLTGAAIFAGGIVSMVTILKEQDVIDNGKELCKENYEKYLT